MKNTIGKHTKLDILFIALLCLSTIALYYRHRILQQRRLSLVGTEVRQHISERVTAAALQYQNLSAQTQVPISEQQFIEQRIDYLKQQLICFADSEKDILHYINQAELNLVLIHLKLEKIRHLV